MSYVDFVLNLAGLLLWINWRSHRFVTPPSALSLASTLKPTERVRASRWTLVSALPLILVFRAVLYWQLSDATEWTPRLTLGLLVVSFRGGTYLHCLVYSMLSFLVTLAVFYLCLFPLCFFNRHVSEPDRLLKLVRMHLGWFSKWPGPFQILAPFWLTGLAWFPLNWCFIRLNVIPSAGSDVHVAIQAVGMSLAVFLAWKYLLMALLFLYFLNFYIYFGNSVLWQFITTTGQNMTRPLKWLCFGKFDLSPLAAMAIVYAAAEFVARWPQWFPAFEQYIRTTFGWRLM